MRVLCVTKIFPNALEPLSSPFNRQQFAALGRLCEVEVLATIPWFPGARLAARWSNAGRLGAVPARETIAGLPVAHPRFLYLPRYGHGAAFALYAASLLAPVVARRGRVDVLLASWAYPDGAAAVLLGRALGVPVVVKLHGSDVNVVARLPGPRRALAALLPRAARVVAVSRPLGEEVVRLGVARERLRLVGNGVDAELFHPRDPDETRRRLGLAARRWIVYVGRLQEEKGVLELIDAFTRLAPRVPDAGLLLVGGEGGVKAEAERRAAPLGDRVVFAGPRPIAEVPLYMSAAALCTLPSWNEGTPNVLIEALACGRPAVATRVGGIPDVICDERLGLLVPPRDPAALAHALEAVLARPYDAAEIARLGSRGGWDESARRLHAVLAEAIADPT
jgi:glycosyltransferase involved in cell wall biosynthesis